MVDTDAFEEKKSFKAIIIFFIIASISFLLFLTPQIIKASQNDYCSVKTLDNNFEKRLSTSSIELTNSTNYFLINTYDSNKHYQPLIVKKEFCFNALNNGSSPLRVNIIDKNSLLLNKAYFPSGNNTVCSLIPNNVYEIGVQCSDCSSSNALIFYENTLSKKVMMTFNDELVNINQIGVTTKEFISCKDDIKDYGRYYIILVALLILTLLIILSINGFGGLVLQ